MSPTVQILGDVSPLSHRDRRPCTLSLVTSGELKSCIYFQQVETDNRSICRLKTLCAYLKRWYVCYLCHQVFVQKLNSLKMTAWFTVLNHSKVLRKFLFFEKLFKQISKFLRSISRPNHAEIRWTNKQITCFFGILLAFFSWKYRPTASLFFSSVVCTPAHSVATANPSFN